MPIVAIIIALVVLAGVFGYTMVRDNSEEVVEFETTVTRTAEEEAPQEVVDTPVEDADPEPTEDDEAVVEAETETVVEKDPDPVVSTPEPVVETPAPVVTTPAPEPEPEPATVYADGTYTSSISYRSPGGNEPMTVTLTVANDVVTSAATSYGSGNATSENYQNRFDGAFKAQVVGQSLSSISLSRVGGASLTSGGFNEAVADIKVDAKS